MKINLGCGGRYRRDWINMDFVPRPPHVMGHDLSKPLPFAEGTADMIYASHVLEHFNRYDGLRLLKECHRVLAPTAVIRIIVPDLEAIARNYLRCLEARRADNRIDPADHLWSVLTMIDQLSRNQSGGEMIEFLRERQAEMLENVFRLEGPEIATLHARLTHPGDVPPVADRPRLASRRSIVRALVLRAKLLMLRFILGPEGEEVARIGKFRLSGEVHYWMYDSVSLGSALEDAGFTDVVVREAHESYLPGWADEHLDTEPGGHVYKPLSLFMEARKPA
ncbi:methyltransferase domain-containing protein [Rhodobacterales bacterium HKCCSP123]|nr:methyltransferase domain-containing protein [Rhodobacterales bacterium HKCCSP123]